MNLLLYWGNSIWGIEAFSRVSLGIFAIVIIVSLVLALQGDRDFFLDAAIHIILVIIFWFFGFPIKGIIITLLVLHILSVVGTLARGGGLIAILPILYVIGDIIGIVLFFKNVL